MTVGELGEHALLARILRRLPPAGVSVRLGPGDDAAVVTPARRRELVVTVDAVVEGVHFHRRWSSPADVGHRALAVNLSDLAAMGATPRWALLSLAVPDACLVADVEALVDGVSALARRHGVSVVGGNVTRSPGPLVVDVTAAGDVGPRKWLSRAGARPGDELWVSGTVGGARAGLEMLRAGVAAIAAGLVTRHCRPEPRVRLGVALSQARAARAAVDLSDGLADAVTRLTEATGCGARIDLDAVPVDPAARDWFASRGEDAGLAAIAGGDDYELLIAVPRRWAGRLKHVRSRVSAPALTRIGELTRDAGCRLVQNGASRPWPSGFEHFRPC